MKPTLPTLRTFRRVLAVLGLGWLLAGCGGGGSKTKMDTSPLTKAFASAEAAVKGPAEEAVKALNAGKLLDGANAMAKVAKAGGENLNDEQKKALIDVSTTIQMIMSEDADKMDLKVYQAIEDLVAAINGRESTTVGTTPDRVIPRTPASQ